MQIRKRVVIVTLGSTLFALGLADLGYEWRGPIAALLLGMVGAVVSNLTSIWWLSRTTAV